MKTIFAIVVLLFISHTALSQSYDFLQASHPETGEVYLIEAGKVVRAVTTDGKRHKDRLTIIDENTIALDGISIPLSEIDKIKKMRNVWVYVLGTITVYYGVSLFAVGILVAALADIGGSVAIGAAVSLVGAGLTYAGINGINPARGFKRYKGWEFKIVAAQDLTPVTN